MARGVNKVIIIGNVGQDPEVKYTASGAPVVTVSIATSEAWRDLDNPQQIEELKQRAKDRLEAEIDTAKQEREQKESELSTARQSLGRENRRIEGLKSYLEELRARLEECIKQCQAQAMDIARGRVSDLEDLMDYSVPQTTEETEEEEEENNVVVNRSRTLC